jgi:hypothetical protein
MVRLFSRSFFRRRLLIAYYNLVNGPMRTELIAPILDAKYAAFQEHGLTAASPGAIKSWITAARNDILTQITRDSAEFAITDVTSATNGGSWMVSGTGPLEMASLLVNGAPLTVTWTSTKAWTAAFDAPAGIQRLTMTGVNGAGQPIAGAVQEVVLTLSNALKITQDSTGLLFEYPAAGDGLFELQAADALVGASWQTIATQAPSAGVVQFRIEPPARPWMFYRVVAP